MTPATETAPGQDQGGTNPSRPFKLDLSKTSLAQPPRVLSKKFYAFVRYMVFLALFTATTLGPASSDSYFLKVNVDNVFVSNEFAFGTSFETLGSTSQLWEFVNTTLLPNLYPVVSYSGKPLSRAKQRFISDGTNLRLGAVRFRQVRMRGDLCSIPDGLKKDQTCVPTYYGCWYDISCNEAKSTMRPSPRNTSDGPGWDYSYTGQPSYRSKRTKITYSGNGYVEDLIDRAPKVNQSAITSADQAEGTGTAPTPSPTFSSTSLISSLPYSVQKQVNRLFDSEWIDPAARALFIEFNLYNPHTDIFSIIRLCVEFSAMGGILTTYRVSSIPFLTSYRALVGDGVSAGARTALFVEILFVAFVLFYIAVEVLEYRAIVKMRRSYDLAKAHIEGGKDSAADPDLNDAVDKELKVIRTWGPASPRQEAGLLTARDPRTGRPKHFFSSGWNVLIIVNLTLFLLYYFIRWGSIGIVVGLDFSESGSNMFYTELQTAAQLWRFATALNAFNGFLSFIQIFKYTRNHAQLGQFSATLSETMRNLGGFVFIVFLVLFAYGTAFWLAFGSDVRLYSDLTLCVLSLFRTILGDFDLDELSHANYFMGPLLFVTFIVIMFFVVLSMVLAIVDEAFNKVRHRRVKRRDILGEDIEYLTLKFTNLLRQLMGKATQQESRTAGSNDAQDAASSARRRERSGKASDVAASPDDTFLAFVKAFQETSDRLQQLEKANDELSEHMQATTSKLLTAESVLEDEKAADEDDS